MWTCNPSPDTPQYPNTHPDTVLCLAEGRGAPRAWFAVQFGQTFGLKLSWVSSWTKFFWTRHLDWDLTAIASVNFLPLCRADADIKQINDSFWTILKKNQGVLIEQDVPFLCPPVNVQFSCSNFSVFMPCLFCCERCLRAFWVDILLMLCTVHLNMDIRPVLLQSDGKRVIYDVQRNWVSGCVHQYLKEINLSQTLAVLQVCFCWFLIHP